MHDRRLTVCTRGLQRMDVPFSILLSESDVLDEVCVAVAVAVAVCGHGGVAVLSACVVPPHALPAS